MQNGETDRFPRDESHSQRRISNDSASAVSQASIESTPARNRYWLDKLLINGAEQKLPPFQTNNVIAKGEIPMMQSNQTSNMLQLSPQTPGSAARPMSDGV